MTTVNPLFVKLCIPTGLEEVLEGLAREVLRRQPENINSFAAVYFDKLLDIRNEAEKCGSDINLQNLIARGKLLDINEEDLIKISIKDETLINDDEIQPIMVTAAAISKPAQIQISQPVDPIINKDDEEVIYANTEREEKLDYSVPVGVSVNKVPDEGDLDKIVTNQDAEEMEIQEIQSEKSSDNSEMDKEEPEELESDLETAIGLQEDQGEEILLQNENTDLLMKAKSKTDVEHENMQGSIEKMNNLENADVIFASGSPRALRTAEFQLNEKPSELIDENVTTEPIAYQLDGILSKQNETTEKEGTAEENSFNESNETSNQITEIDEGSSLKSIEAKMEDSVDTFVRENDGNNKVETIEIEEIEGGSLSDELSTSKPIENNEDSSLEPIVEVDDPADKLEREQVDINKNEKIEIEEIIEGSASNELMNSDQTQKSDEDSSLKPIEAEIEDYDDKLVTGIDDKNKDSEMTALEDPVIQPINGIEMKTLNEIAETGANTAEIQNERMDSELALMPNTAESQSEMVGEEIKRDEEVIEVSRETDVETNKETNIETKEETEKRANEETEKGTKEEKDTENRKETVTEEAREDSQDSEVMFTMNEKSETAKETETVKDFYEEQTPVQQNEEIIEREDQPENNTEQIEVVKDELYLENKEDLFEVQAVKQLTEMIREIEINENLSANIALEETADKILDKVSEDELQENLQTAQIKDDNEPVEVGINQDESSGATEDNLLQDPEKNTENSSEGEFSEISQSLQTTIEEKQADTDITELESISVSSNAEEAQSNIASEAISFQEMYEVQSISQEHEEIKETKTDENLTVAVAIKETTDETEENALKDELQEIPQNVENIKDDEDPENLTIASEEDLPEESTDQIEENVLTNELQEFYQNVQIPEDEKQTEIDITQLESTVATEVALFEDTNDKKDEEATVAVDVKLLKELTDQISQDFPEESTDQIEENVPTNELQELYQNVKISEDEKQTEIDITQLESTVATEVALFEDTNDKKDEEATVAVDVKLLEELTDQISQDFPEESTDQIEENAPTNELQELYQNFQIPEDEKQTEIDITQLESTVATEAALFEDTDDKKDEEATVAVEVKLPKELTDQIKEKVTENQLSEIVPPVQIVQEEQTETDINQLESTVVPEVGLLEDSVDKIDEEIYKSQPLSQGTEGIREIKMDDNLSKILVLEVIKDEIEEKTLANEFQEISQPVQGNKSDEQNENDVNLEELTSETDVVFEESTDTIVEKIPDEEFQEVLQSVQPPEDYSQSENENNQMESTDDNSNAVKTDSNLMIDESERLTFESTNLQEDEDLAYRLENDASVPEQITYDIQVSAVADEGQEIEEKSKLPEERNDNEPANMENVDTPFAKVDDTLRTEALERDADIVDQIQGADKLETFEGKPEDVEKSGAALLLQNGELEKPNAETSHESGEILITQNLDEINNENSEIESSISKDMIEDEIIDNSEENQIELITDNNQKQTDDVAKNNVEELYEENSKEFQQNAAGLKEDEIVRLEEIREKTIDEEESTDVKSISEYPESQKEITVDDATIARMQVQDENLDVIRDGDNDVVTEDKDDSFTLNPEEILKSEADLVNELDKKSEDNENEMKENIERAETPMEISTKKQNDKQTESKQELEGDDLEILEENAPQDSILPDESLIINDEINQPETQKESDTSDQFEKNDKDSQQAIEENEIECLKAIENENQAVAKEEAVVNESIVSLNNFNEQDELPISDNLQTSDPLNTMDQSSQLFQIETIEQDPRMENQTTSLTELSNNEAKIEVEKEDGIEETATDALKDDEQLGQITEISEELIVPGVDQQLTSDWVDSSNFVNSDEKIDGQEMRINQLLIESKQPSIALAFNDNEIRNENANNSADVEILSKTLNNTLEEQIASSLNDEIMDLDSLEYEYKRSDEISGAKYEALELDSLEYNQATEEKANQMVDGQELDSLEVNKIIDDYRETKPELKELESSLEIDEAKTNEENLEIESEQSAMFNDQEIVIDDGNSEIITTEAPMEDKPASDFKQSQPTSENELESEFVDQITEKINAEMDNNDNTTEISEEPENNGSRELTSEPDIIDELEVIQRFSNEPDNLANFEQASDEKADQGSLTYTGEESTNSNPAEENEENEGVLLKVQDFENLEANDETMPEASITQDINFNEELQLINSDEQLITINEPESDTLDKNNDEVLNISEEINADDVTNVLEASEEISLETDVDATVQVSEFVPSEQIEINNEEIIGISEKKENAPRLADDDALAISEEVLIKEVEEDLESNKEENLENTSEMQAADLTITSRNVEEEVKEPEIIKEIEQLDELNLTELYNKLEINNEANSNENQENENMGLENQELEKINESEEIIMNESIIGLNETHDASITVEDNGNGLKNDDEVDEQENAGQAQLGNGRSSNDTDEDFSNQEILQKELEEKYEETLNSTDPDVEMYVKEEVFMTEEEIKQDNIESFSNAQTENNQIDDKQLNVDIPVETLTGLDKYNQEDDEKAIDFDEAENLTDTNEKTQNQEENSQEVSTQAAESLIENGEETVIQEHFDDGSLLSKDTLNSKETQLLDQLFTLDSEEVPIVNNVEQLSETNESYNDEPIEEADINKTENMGTTKLPEVLETVTLEENQSDKNALTEFESDKTSEETTAVVEDNGETLIENTDVQIQEQTDINDSNTIVKDSLTESGQEINNSDNDGEQPVEDSNSKTNSDENIEMLSLSKEANEVEVPELTIEINKMSELGNNQNTEEIETNNIWKNDDDDDSDFLATGKKNEINPEMSGETSLLEEDADVDNFIDLPETMVEDGLTMASAVTQSLQLEQPSESESIDMKNTLATRIDDSEAPILPQDEYKPEEERQEESKPENRSQEKCEVVGNEQGLESIIDVMTNDEQAEIIVEETLQEKQMNQPDEETDIGEDTIKAFLDGQTDESIIWTDIETEPREVRNELSNKQQIRDITQNVQLDRIPKPIPDELRKPKEQDKNGAKSKEQVKEESSINGFEILGHSIVLKPKKNHDKTDANYEQPEQTIAIEQELNSSYTDKNNDIASNQVDQGLPVSQVESKGQDGVNGRISPEITVAIYKQYGVNDDFMETSIKDFEDINDVEQDQLNGRNTITEGDDQDEDNDVMIGQGLTSPPEEQITAIKNLVP